MVVGLLRTGQTWSDAWAARRSRNERGGIPNASNERFEKSALVGRRMCEWGVEGGGVTMKRGLPPNAHPNSHANAINSGSSRNFGSLLLIYFAAWLLVFYLMPNTVSESKTAKSFIDFVSTIVPSINVYAENSPDKSRVAIFMAMHWSLLPIYVYYAFKRWGRMYKQRRFADQSSRRSALIYSVLLVIIAGAAAFLPQSISLDEPAIRPSRMWREIMHEYLLANGIFAVGLPLCSAGFLLAAWLIYKIGIPNVITNRS